ncbi:MAG: hypothetical protein U1C70_13795 [Sediminibacterium sp.]|uniref:hypothetical protein n=1 Tax=Sediminibacterium sp. TaxID=1917865 RepID=UPI002ABC8A20|nr:hypothetical protein [Sediminibacterium sp.]MDZ4072894.1 hypothetical protein [Sediminibacterium sp.]
MIASYLKDQSWQKYKLKPVKNDFGGNAEPVVLIFPTKGCTYGNLVDVLDEMMINGLKRYMLLDKEV